MQIFLSAAIFAISSNLDKLVIGIAYGIQKIKIGFLSGLLIAWITVTGTLLSMYAGRFIAKWLPLGITDLLGSGIVILLGIYFVLQSVSNLWNRKKRVRSVALKDSDSMMDYAESSDKDISGTIDVRESVGVGFGLMFNNIGTGIAASTAGMHIPAAGICTFCFSILFLYLGVYFGNKMLGRILGKYAPLLSGILLILLGLLQQFV